MNPLDLLYLPAAVVTAPWWARKARGGWKQRFGHAEPLPQHRQEGLRGCTADVDGNSVTDERDLMTSCVHGRAG